MSVSSPQLGQENLHHSHHVHVHVQREGGMGRSRSFNIVNLQESVSARHSQSPGAGNAELLHCLGITSTLTAPYHDATPAGAVEGVGAHWGSVLVLDVQGRVGTLWHIQQEVQHRVERGSTRTCSGTESENPQVQQVSVTLAPIWHWQGTVLWGKRDTGPRHGCLHSLSKSQSCESQVRSAELTQSGFHWVDDMWEAVGAQEEAGGLLVKAWCHS